MARGLMAVGGFMFWFGDKALQEFAHLGWVLSEVLGMGAALLFLLAGLGLKAYAED